MEIPSPCYVLEESLLRRNLELIRSVQDRAEVKIILAFKSFAFWKAFPIVREYIGLSTASSIWEAQLAYEEMGAKAHTFSPAYTDENIDTYIRYSSHITFNSLSQYDRFGERCRQNNISCGVRINPEYSEVETLLYNPCAPGSRFGVVASDLTALPEGVEGIHFHTLCEGTSYDLEKTLVKVEERFGHLFPSIKWINMGGGHLMTAAKYDPEHLITLLRAFKQRHPHLEVILEPGSAFGWQTGYLRSSVVDIVENHGIRTAIVDVSFACHMPDCIEMPYQPTVRNATIIEDAPTTPHRYRIGGNSCLSGDYMGDWCFDQPLSVGDTLIFEDMIHYTIVKTTTFNGISHPSIGIVRADGSFDLLRTFTYEDYKNRQC